MSMKQESDNPLFENIKSLNWNAQIESNYNNNRSSGFAI